MEQMPLMEYSGKDDFEETQRYVLKEMKYEETNMVADKDDENVLIVKDEKEELWAYLLNTKHLDENAEEISYLKTQLKSYSKRFSNTLLKGESTYDSLLEKGDALNDKALSLEAGLGRLENLLGGATIDAEGVDREGTVHKGKIAMVGPALWFQSSNGDIAGSVVLDKGSQTASVVGEDEENISALFNGDEVEASIDLTGGKARALESIDNSFTGLFKKGGLWVWPII